MKRILVLQKLHTDLIYISVLAWNLGKTPQISHYLPLAHVMIFIEFHSQFNFRVKCQFRKSFSSVNNCCWEEAIPYNLITNFKLSFPLRHLNVINAEARVVLKRPPQVPMKAIDRQLTVCHCFNAISRGRERRRVAKCCRWIGRVDFGSFSRFLSDTRMHKSVYCGLMPVDLRSWHRKTAVLL